MAQQDNTLGAPTEGLGQTVTFGAGGVRPPQKEAFGRRPMQVAMRGGEARLTAQAVDVPAASPDPTFAALMRLGGEILQPRLEQERKEAFVRGMQKAATGQAITEIVSEQPWYSQVFGSTSLVDGARAYAASAKAAQVATDLETGMEELRKLPPEAFAKHVAEVMKGSATGDSVTDAIVTQQLANHLPAVLKSQAKNHILFKQEEFGLSVSANMDATLAGVGAADVAYRNPANATDGRDVIEKELKALDAFTKPDGIPDDTFYKLSSDSVVKAINSGNFAAYELVKTSKVMDKFSPQGQAAIEQAHYRAVQRAKLDLPLEFAEQMADFMVADNDPSNTQEVIEAKAKALNEGFTRITGARVPLINMDDLSKGLANLRLTKQREAEKLAAKAERLEERAADKRERAAERAAAAREAEVKDERDIVDTAIKLADGHDLGWFTPKQLAASWALLDRKWGGTPEGREKLARVRALQASGDSTDVRYKRVTQQAIMTAAANRDVVNLYNIYQNDYLPLVRAGGTRQASALMGDGAAVMEKYHQLAGGRGLDDNLKASIGGQASLEVDKPTLGKESKEVTKALKSVSWWAKVTGSRYPMRNAEGLQRLILPRGNLETDDAVAIALDEAEAAGRLTTIAGHWWPRGEGLEDIKKVLKNPVDTAGAPAILSGELNDAFDFAVNKRLKDSGLEGEPAIVQTVVNGKPVLALTAKVRGELTAKVVNLYPKEIQSMWQEHKKPKPMQLPTPGAPTTMGQLLPDVEY